MSGGVAARAALPAPSVPSAPYAPSAPVALAAAAALGALQTLAYAHTAWWALQLLATAALAALLRRATPRRAFALGWCYGTAWLAAGVWWLFISLHRYGGIAAPLAALAVLLLAAALALYLAAAAWAFARWRSGRLGADALLWAALWLLAELARGVLFTGFPWVAAGYAHVDSPLAALAPFTGVYGIGAAGAGLTALAGLALGDGPRAWRRALPGFGALAAALALGAWAPRVQFSADAGEISVVLLQSNVPQDEKFAAASMPETLGWVVGRLLGARAELVIAPETAVPLLPAQLDEVAPGFWGRLEAHFKAAGTAALVGRPLGDFDRGYTNSVVGIGGGEAEAYRYDKTHLVPFGEFVPWGFRWLTEAMHIPLGDFERGPLDPPSFRVGKQRVAPNICYEDLFGEELARRFVDPSRAPTLLANLSNIGWFGETSAVAQHLNISRLRALELQRPVVRATNTGATAAIAHDGRVLALLAPYTRGQLEAQVQGRMGLTPFARWAGHLGLWPLAVLALAVLAHAAARPSGGTTAAP